MVDVLRSFPDTIKIKIGDGWILPLTPGSYRPFEIGDEITLIPVESSREEDSGVYDTDGTWQEQGVMYSEDGTTVAADTNRLTIGFYGYWDGNIISDTYSSYNKEVTVAVRRYNYNTTFMTAAYFQAFKEFFDVTEIPNESYYTFLDIYLMESRFGYTSFYNAFVSDYGFIDPGATEKLWYNSKTFAEMSAVSPALPAIGINRIFQPLNFDSIGIQQIKNGFGIEGRTIISGGFGFQAIQNIKNNIGTFAQSIQKSLNSIFATSINPIFRFKNLIEDKNNQLGINKITGAIGDLNITAVYPVVTYEIYLDGNPIKSKITSLQISMAESSIHNSFTFTSTDTQLYNLCNPVTNYKQMRIEIHVGIRVFLFLLEERSGNYSGFTIWGRSLSAKLDNPYEKETNFSITGKEKASSLAGTLADTVAINFLIDDWIIPETFNYVGLKIDGLLKIAQEVESLLRSDDDGTIVIRNKYPVRPININVTKPAITYNAESNLITLDVAEKIGTKENIIQVQGYAEEIVLPILELEESPNGQLKRKDDIFVRAYWGTETPPEITEVYATAGKAVKQNSNNSEINEETVTFEDGKATVSKPIVNLISTTWIGQKGNDVDWKKLSNEIYISDLKARVATVKYKTVYDRYRIYGHDVLTLIYVMVINSKYSVSIKVLMGNEDKEAQAITKPLLTDNNTAIKAGTAYLDDKKYDSIEIDFEAPYNDLAKDGIIIRLEDPQLELYGNCHIRDCEINFDGPKVTNKIKAVKFKI